MADDNTTRFQHPSDPPRRGLGAPRFGGEPAGGDPLAELARLIGESEPLSEGETFRSRRSAAREPRSTASPTPTPSAAGDWRKMAAAMRPYETSDAAEEELPPYEAPERSGDFSAAGMPYEPHDRFDPAQLDDLRQDDRQYAQYGRDHHVESDAFEGRYKDTGHEDGPGSSSEAPYYDEGDPVGPRDEDIYDDPQRGGRSSGLITAVTLIACAMIGTAGAYGYRTYYVGSGAHRVPPIITAETTPTKVMTTIDPLPTKSIQDRVGDQSQERVVSREEQPVELTNPPLPSAPRIVLPAPVAPPPAPGLTSPVIGDGQQTTASVPPATASSSAAGGGPKRIHTVTIRPDGTDLGTQASVIPASPGSTVPPRPATAARPSAPARGAGPLSLAPQAGESGLPAEPRERLATAPASIPVSPSTPGGYVVQLSSQRSETEAQASFRALQAKFPNQLGSRTPIIRRADLGDKGIYYRAMVGPFANAEEASRFCGSYKAAGGQCIIQRN